MFTRNVTMKLKPNTAPEFKGLVENEILPLLRKQQGFRDEFTFVAPERSEVLAISLWESKEDAEAYNRAGVSGDTEDRVESRRRYSQGRDLRAFHFDTAQACG